MEDKLRKYVDELFEDTAPTKKAVELKEEMIQNLTDKYSDLIAEGKSPEAAYNIAIAGIGDVSVLLRELETDEYAMPGSYEFDRKKAAMFTSIAVMVYFLSVLPLIILAIVGSPFVASVGVPVMFLMIAGATGLLVYNNMTKPKPPRGPETMVDEFRQWQSDSHYKKSMRRAISAALWTSITALYFIISFWTFAWHISWIVFVLGAVIESIINIFYSLRK